MAMIPTEINRQLLRLPPRSRLRDWFWAGASAGLILSMAEFAVAYPPGISIPARLAICVLVLEAGITCAGSSLVGFVLGFRRVNVSRSGLVGAVIGPQIFTSIAGGFPAPFDPEGSWVLLNFAGLLMASGLAVAAGWAAFRIADSLERRGFIVSAPLVWGGAGLVLALCERMFAAERLSGAFSLIGAIAAVLAVSAAAWALSVAVQLRSSSAARPFGWLFGWLSITAFAAAAAPAALPWLFYDPESPTREEGPPNLLVVAIPAAEGAEADARGSTPTFEGLGVAGRRYRLEDAASLAAVRALLADAHGDALAPQLAAAGYATAAILPSEKILPELMHAETDAGAGGRGLLEGRLHWLAVAPLLQGTAAPLLAVLGIDTVHRSAEQVARRAQRWLLGWRSDRAATPFLLFVDLRGANPPGGGVSIAERSDAYLGDLLKELELLDTADSTLVVALRAPAEGDDRPMHVAIHGPGHRLFPSGTHGVRARSLGELLLRVSRTPISPTVELPR